MKKTFLILIGLVVATPVWAAIVHLNSGTAITGKILESTAETIKVDVEGVTVTYYKDEVSSIEGDEGAAKILGVAAIAPAAPAQGAPAAAPSEAPAIAPSAVEPVAPVPAVAPSAAEPVAPVPAVAPSAAEPVAPAPAVAPSPVAPVAPAKEVAPTMPVAAPSAVLSPEKKEKILKFIEVFGTRETMKMNFDQILASMPPQDAEKLKGAFNIDEVIQELIPLYDKYFTSEDLDGFIQFYSSPTGHKLVQTIPLIMKESVDVSAKYFEEHLPADMKGETPPPQK
jgi:hypothetical protein